MPAVVRGTRLSAQLALAVMLAVPLATPAAAQGLLQSLFGLGSSPPPRPVPQYYPQRPVSPYYTPFRSAPGSGVESGGGGSYRTVCVRMCDGYYFPISHGVSRSHFTRDAAACQSSCGSEARLFYAPSNGSADDFVDLGGRSYSQIPNAFKYRKALSPSCACKPAPWSEAELARHQRYAAEAGRAAAPVAVAEPEKQPVQGKLASAEKPSGRTKAPGTAPSAAQPAPIAAPVAASVMVIEPAAPKQPAASHAVQEAAPAKAQIQQAAPYAAQAEPQQIKPATAGPVRLSMPSAAPIARPAPRMASAPPPPVKVATKPAASAAAPVYSHEQGRFVFPGDRRYQ